MIIEATPRPPKGPLEGYTPSLANSAHSKERTPIRKLSPHHQSKVADLQKNLSDNHAGSPIIHCKSRKTSFRGHPYDRDANTDNRKYWNSLLFSLSLHKCPSFLRRRQKFVRLNKILKSKTGRKESDRTPVHIPYFTANANENNDNCPSSTYANGGFAVSRGIPSDSPIPLNHDQICDVEIEDLTTENAPNFPESLRKELENHPSWRERRKSFNTNPLSSTSSRNSSEDPPSLLHLNEIVPRTSNTAFQTPNKQEADDPFTPTPGKPNIYQILGLEPRDKTPLSFSPPADKQFSVSQPSAFNFSCSRNQKRNDRKTAPKSNLCREEPSNLPSSIGRLVEFFESNSNVDCNNNEANFESSQFERGCKNLDSSRASSGSPCTAYSHTRASSRSNDIKLFEPNRGSSSPIDFSRIFRNTSWDSVIKPSPEFQLARSSDTDSKGKQVHTPGGVFNNNANAASTTSNSGRIRLGNQFEQDRFSSVSYQDSRYKSSLSSSASSSSALFLPSQRGRSSSSLSRVSSDVELIDLETTRLSSWPGTHSVPAAFERQTYQAAESQTSSADHLIDLHTTSRTGWFGNSNRDCSNFAKKSQTHKSLEFLRHPCNSNKASEHGHFEDSRRSSFCQVKAQGSHCTASANNHHNAPAVRHFKSHHGSSSDSDLFESIFQDSCEAQNQERQFPFGDFPFHHSILNPLFRKKEDFFRSESFSDMGCIQSIAKSKVSPDRCHHGVIVEDIRASIDRTPTEIEEKSPIVLRYRTPYFRASAHVIVPPIPRKETWTVGWIQACDSMKFINQYGDLGNSSWEIPALKDRRITAVSDSDGVSYPWYGNTTEIATVEGPTDTSRSLTLRMNDNFYPSVTWDIPVSEGSEAHLTHIIRDQSFTTWLAAVNQTTGRLEVLRTVKWHFYLEIEVDPAQELGKRARIVSPLEQKQPIVLKNNTEPIYISSPRRSNTPGSAGAGGRQKRLNRRPGAGGDNNSNNHTNFIPKSALVRPSANNAQTLIWRPTRDIPVIVVPPKEEYKENNEVVWFTRTPSMHGHDHNVRILSMQEMSQLKKTIS